MGIFDKLKNLVSRDKKEEVQKYDEGLTKTREDFVNKLSLLELIGQIILMKQ